MTEQRPTILSRITPYLSVTEMIFLAGLAIGLILAYFNTDSNSIIKVSLLGLAITYFLTAFKIIDIPRQDDEKYEFKDFLALTIVPKVIWLTCAFSLLGLLAYTMQFGNDGYKQGFRIGVLGIPIGLGILTYAYFTGTKHLKYVLPTVTRAVPILIVDFYLLNN